MVLTQLAETHLKPEVTPGKNDLHDLSDMSMNLIWFTNINIELV